MSELGSSLRAKLSLTLHLVRQRGVQCGTEPNGMMMNYRVGIELYSSPSGSVSLQVLSDTETVWLTRQQMAVLFGRDVKTIGKHIANARREELSEVATVAKFATVQREGDREVKRLIEHYSLDMVLSVGYRVKSREGVYFRRWATEVLKQHLTLR